MAFDPGYICKSGKKTPGVGWSWAGCANQTKWKLEILGHAAIDLDNQKNQSWIPPKFDGKVT